MSSECLPLESSGPPRRASDAAQAITARFIQGTASAHWLPIPELVADLSRSGYWELVGNLDAAQQAAHVREQVGTLRDADGCLLFERLDVRLDGAITTVYNQAGLDTEPRG